MSRKRLSLFCLAAVLLFVLVSGLSAHFAHHWPETTGPTRHLSPQLVQGRIIRTNNDVTHYAPDHNGIVALALPTSPFKAQQYPLFEIALPHASRQWQYRLVWASSSLDQPSSFILNQPFKGVSLTDLSNADGWQGEITQLGLVIEQLFPLGWSRPDKNIDAQIVTAGPIQLPGTSLWQAIRHQSLVWLGWQIPHFRDINHLPYSRQLPWYASPAAVIALTVMVLGIVLTIRARRISAILPVVLAGSAVMAMLWLPQMAGTWDWSRPARMLAPNDRLLTSEVELAALVDEIPSSARQILILDNGYAGLRLYWHLLPRNAMWFPGWPEQLVFRTGQVFLLPVSNETLFAQLISTLQDSGLRMEVDRAGNDWWQITVLTNEESTS